MVGENKLYSGRYESELLKVFGRSPQMRLLDFFMDNPRHDFTRSEIREAIGMAKRTLYEYLPILEDEGVVEVSRKIGRAELFMLNKDSPIVKYFRRIEKALTEPEDIRQSQEQGREEKKDKPIIA